jgi:hypothetical protein
MAKPKNSGPVVEDASSRSFRTAKVKQDVPSDAAVSEANSENVGATEVPLKFTPSWSDWNERHTISLFNAVCLEPKKLFLGPDMPLAGVLIACLAIKFIAYEKPKAKQHHSANCGRIAARHSGFPILRTAPRDSSKSRDL